ncbi:hypothetical protein V502_08353 [Pseudogymnoascus sp. VKM F-4520 (FW-2644)]|nr:hypothetical protein V502_08353 [Pseudogymnoascus sp. VKM F-4520 (FW-2644)]
MSSGFKDVSVYDSEENNLERDTAQNRGHDTRHARPIQSIIIGENTSFFPPPPENAVVTSMPPLLYIPVTTSHTRRSNLVTAPTCHYTHPYARKVKRCL